MTWMGMSYIYIIETVQSRSLDRWILCGMISRGLDHYTDTKDAKVSTVRNHAAALDSGTEGKRSSLATTSL